MGRYWDNSYNNFQYSYVNVAVDEYKYHTVAIDRLGVGLSSHGEPLNEIQAPLEVAALAEITRKLRDGTFPGISKPYEKVVHVGYVVNPSFPAPCVCAVQSEMLMSFTYASHSFGAAQSYALANLYPSLTNGIILTGFTLNGTFVPFFVAGSNFVLASTNQPFRLGSSALSDPNVPNADGIIDYSAPPTPSPLHYPTGYLTNANVGSTQYLFFLPGYFDSALLLAGEKTKQPVTPGELLTLPSLPPTNNFCGPVLVFTGDADLPYCGGDCLATGDPSVPDIPSQVAKAFPDAVGKGDFESYVQPRTGHGLNFHFNATEGYKVIQGFLRRKGLASQ